MLPSFYAKRFFIGIYGIATNGQIKDGKHMYKALEAHFSLYLAFYKLYMSRFIDDNQVIKKQLKKAVMNVISDVPDYVKEKKDHAKHKNKYLLDAMQYINLLLYKMHLVNL